MLQVSPLPLQGFLPLAVNFKPVQTFPFLNHQLHIFPTKVKIVRHAFIKKKKNQ